MVPTPIELEGPNTSAMDVNSSGADDPAARNVAPATSGVRPSTCALRVEGDYAVGERMRRRRRRRRVLVSGDQQAATQKPGKIHVLFDKNLHMQAEWYIAGLRRHVCLSRVCSRRAPRKP